MKHPNSFHNEDELEDFLSIPHSETVNLMKRLDGDIIILGIGGKMGPTLGKMIVKAIEQAGVSKKVYGISRFSDKTLRHRLENRGTIVDSTRCTVERASRVVCSMFSTIASTRSI